VDDRVATPLCVLGPLEIVRDGDQVRLGSAQQRRLLAALLVHANEVVSSDRLIDVLWGDDSPRSATHTLQTLLSRLRATIGDDRLETCPPGYRLLVETVDVDASRFEELVRVGLGAAEKPEVALRVFDEALGLWRGSPYAEFATEEFATAEVARLGELRARAIEERSAALLDLGRPADVIGELETEIAAEPFRERLRALLMLALARAGRPVESLRAYDAFRRFLADEIGVMPSPGLQALNDDIVRQHPDISWAGSPTKEDLPSGTFTYLFTDVEGSTRLWDAHPHGMRDALARHDELVCAAVVERHGHVVKMTGDGVHAAFANAADALGAAVDAQRRLGDEVWGEIGDLRVRMGIHSGQADARDGDYYGTSVNKAARLMGAAHGGQVVCSQTTAELARDSLAPEVGFVDLGERRLRDLAQPVRVFQVIHPDLRRGFPPLQALDSFTTNLPMQRTSFVGRDAELAAVKGALDSARLVTLTGVGGVGKTRLAVEVAAEVVAEYPDGVWLVELAAVGDPDAVPGAVATTVGLVPRAGGTLTESVAEALAGRRSLLVFDNCEHVLDAVAELVEAILARPGTVKVLATSREGLRLDDERLWPVPSLGGRDRSDDAITLFVDRACAVSPDFALDQPGAADAVGEICRRLDGIPLAIELAAARTIAMSAPELRDRLDDRFRLLSGSRRGLERHQTLRHAVQWSYDLLDDDERALLDRCAMFAGGFDLAAVVAVGGAGALDEYAVFDLLEALVRKSLVVADRSSGRTRYSLLETIRQFAEERLAATDDIADVRARHARYYAGAAAELFTLLGGSREVEGFAWVRLELPNLRAAFRAAADDGDLDTSATIAVVTAALGYFLEIFEPASWAEELLDEARARDHPQVASLYSVASICAVTGRVADAARYADTARALLDDPRYEPIPCGTATAYVGLGYLHTGRPGAWVDFCHAAITRDPAARAYAGRTLIGALILAGRSDEAFPLAADIVEIAEATGSPLTMASALGSVGWAYFDRDPPMALAAFRGYESSYHEHGWTMGHTSALLARAEAAHGEPVAALEACRRSLLAYAASGDRTGACTPLTVLASLLHWLGRDEPAATVAGAGASPMVKGYPELVAAIADLRTALGADAFDSLADRGQTMEMNAMFRYALEQVDEARIAVDPVATTDSSESGLSDVARADRLE
jgi:predicted ATPase/class 3 adenylate cyclase